MGSKEAASKALGTGIGAECGFKDIIISKTHDGGFAVAVVIIF